MRTRSGRTDASSPRRSPPFSPAHFPPISPPRMPETRRTCLLARDAGFEERQARGGITTLPLPHTPHASAPRAPSRPTTTSASTPYHAPVARASGSRDTAGTQVELQYIPHWTATLRACDGEDEAGGRGASMASPVGMSTRRRRSIRARAAAYLERRWRSIVRAKKDEEGGRNAAHTKTWTTAQRRGVKRDTMVRATLRSAGSASASAAWKSGVGRGYRIHTTSMTGASGQLCWNDSHYLPGSRAAHLRLLLFPQSSACATSFSLPSFSGSAQPKCAPLLFRSCRYACVSLAQSELTEPARGKPPRRDEEERDRKSRR
ncbi:hypothetical protein C8R47DRAFT_290145 [Mycena vitilis]|nr:hypothetical protein C8R47DRAFT_290145 [Mycena vitilis]